LRHEIPLGIPDPFVYIEREGTKHAFVPALEGERLAGLGGIHVHPNEEVGADELIAAGLEHGEIRRQLAVNACRLVELQRAIVPQTFPAGHFVRLRAEGVELSVDQASFDRRRRVKTEAELAGIRRAQRAAEAGMRAAAQLLAAAVARNGTLMLEREPLTVERVKAAVAAAFDENGCTTEDFIVAPGAQGALGHEMGHGPIGPHQPVVVDLWPRDRDSACYADMTRTLVGGAPTEELAEWHRLTQAALARATERLRAGVPAKVVFDAACEVYEDAGLPTLRTKVPGQPLLEGFFHPLGHGVGLEVHERPYLGLVADGELVAGDVVTLEPGTYRQGYGGVRLEDLVVVTEDGCEVLTDFPYDLEVTGA
jgi:Xaa-Pro aminopeptidase